MYIVGWTQPPHPVDIIPSFDPHGSRLDQTRAVLLDFLHDDDLRGALASKFGGAISADFAPPMLGWNKKLVDLDPNLVFQVFLSPEGTAAYLSKFNQRTITGADIRAQDWFKKLQAAVPKAIAKRMKLGMLPPNDYSSDPITIYYYDNDRIKRIHYPRAAISPSSGFALDPNNRQWWKGNNITTEERHDDGTWGDEGFDWNKDVVGNVSQILQVIVTAIGAILVATGVGAGVGAAFIAFGTALAAYAGIIDASLSGGDVGKAAAGFLGACTKLIGLEISTLPNGLEKTVLQQTTAMLGKFSTILQANTGKSFQENADALVSQAKTIGQVTDDAVNQLVLMGGGHALQAGYDAAQFADSASLQGAASVIPDDSTRTLFEMGAYLGLVKKQQGTVGYAAPAAVASPRATLHSFVRALPHVTMSPAAGSVALTNYVHDVLYPRYHLT